MSGGAVLRMRFGRFDRITLDGIPYRWQVTSVGGHIFARVDDPDWFEEFSHERLDQLFKQEQFRHERNYFTAAQAKVRLISGDVEVSSLSIKERRQIDLRVMFCERFLRMEEEGEASRAEDSMRRAILIIDGERREEERRARRARSGKSYRDVDPPTPRTLRRWLGRFLACDRDPMALRSEYRRSGNRRPRLHPEVRELLVKYAGEYASLTRPTKRSLHLRLLSELAEINQEREARGEDPLPEPSRKAMDRQINELDPFMVAVGRHGKEAALRKHRALGTGVELYRPLERVEIDEWNVSLHTLMTSGHIFWNLSPEEQKRVPRTRTWLTLAIDARTRCILALHLSENAPSTASGMATLSMIHSDKSKIARNAGTRTQWDMYGSAEEIICDNGVAFNNFVFRDAAACLGTTLTFAPAGKPQLRARVERMFGTLHTRFLSPMDGRTFENVVARGDYPAEERAILTVDELYQLLVRHVVDVYHNTPHSGLDEETPRNCWMRLVNRHLVISPPPRSKLREIFGVPLQRKIGRWGIRVLGLRYWSEPLDTLGRAVKDHVEVRVSEDDIGRISVRNGDDWMAVPAVLKETAGVSIAEWIETRRLLKRRFAIEAELAKPVVLAAISEAQEILRLATERAGLRPPVLTTEDLDRAERELGVQMRLTDDPPDDGFDLFSEDVRHPDQAVGGRVPKSGDAGPEAGETPNEKQVGVNNQTSRFGDENNWSMED